MAEIDDYSARVLDVVDAIPAGQVMSYGDVAEYLGAGGPRQVGRVMARYGGGGALVAGDPRGRHAGAGTRRAGARALPGRGDAAALGRAAGARGHAQGPLAGDELN